MTKKYLHLKILEMFNITAQWNIIDAIIKPIALYIHSKHDITYTVHFIYII